MARRRRRRGPQDTNWSQAALGLIALGALMVSSASVAAQGTRHPPNDAVLWTGVSIAGVGVGESSF